MVLVCPETTPNRLVSIIPAITGKVELVYEGEQEGAFVVAQNLLGKAIRALFTEYFPNPEASKRKKQTRVYQPIIDWFGAGHSIDLLNDISKENYQRTLTSVPNLINIVEKYHAQATASEKLFLMEFLLHGLAEYSLLSKSLVQSGFNFGDLFASMFDMTEDEN